MRQPHQTCDACGLCAKVFGVLECRALPPSAVPVDGTVRSYWPEVDKLDWCGSWVPRD